MEKEISTEEKDSIRVYQIMLVAAGIVYPLWSVFLALAIPHEFDDPLGRAIFGGIAILVSISSLGSSTIRSMLQFLAPAAFSIITVHFYFLIHYAELSAVYVVGAMIVAVFFNLAFPGLKPLFFYSFVGASSSVLVSVLTPVAPLDNKLMLVAGIVTVQLAAIFSTKFRLDAMRTLENEQAINRELEKRVESRTAELKRAQHDLLEKAHQAGMAEIAVGIVHNFGNVLNSVRNASSTMKETLRTSQVRNLKKANELLAQNIDNIDEFISHDPKGKKLMKYYLAIGKGFEEEHSKFANELGRQQNRLDMMRDLVSAQMEYATVKKELDEVHLDDLITNFLTLVENSVQQNNVSIDLEIESSLPSVGVDKSKFLHILLNLYKNALEAMDTSAKRKMRISVSNQTDGIYLRFADCGTGIKAENLESAFAHGFTDKENGHGFGLHTCSNYMTEMDGKIWMEPEGLDESGVTVVLKFPRSEMAPTEMNSKTPMAS